MKSNGNVQMVIIENKVSRLWQIQYCHQFRRFILIFFQVLGHKEGLNVMEKADPLFLLIGLPTIPVMLILGKMVRWEDYILRLWRKHSSKLPLLSYFWPDGRFP